MNWHEHLEVEVQDEVQYGVRSILHVIKGDLEKEEFEGRCFC